MCDILCKLQSKISRQSQLDDIMQCFNDSSPFDGLETQYFQEKYYRQHFNLLVSLFEHVCLWPEAFTYGIAILCTLN